MLEPLHKRRAEGRLTAHLCSGLNTHLSSFVLQLCHSCHYGLYVFLASPLLRKTFLGQACLPRPLPTVSLTFAKHRIGFYHCLQDEPVVGWGFTDIQTDIKVTLTGLTVWHDLNQTLHHSSDSL